MTQGYLHFETEADIRRHLGISRSPKLEPYDRAWAMLEDADRRLEKARDIVSFEPARLRADFTKPASQAAADLYARVWPVERIIRWKVAHRSSRVAALAAVEDARAVHDARALAYNTSIIGDTRSYAKAVAARIEVENSVWADAYGRAMPKEFWAK